MIASSIPLAKFTTACPLLFLFPNPCLPMHSSSPLFPSPTCSFRSAFTTIFTFFGIFSTVSFRSNQNASFSSRMHPTCGAYALITFNIIPSSSIFKHIILSVTLHNSTTLFSCSFFVMISIHSFCFRFHRTTFYILHLCILLSPPFSKFPAHTACPLLFAP